MATRSKIEGQWEWSNGSSRCRHPLRSQTKCVQFTLSSILPQPTCHGCWVLSLSWSLYLLDISLWTSSVHPKRKTFAPLCREIIQKKPHSISLSHWPKEAALNTLTCSGATWYEAHDNLNVATANLNRKAEKRAYDKGMGLQSQWILCNHAQLLMPLSL